MHSTNGSLISNSFPASPAVRAGFEHFFSIVSNGAMQGAVSGAPLHDAFGPGARIDRAMDMVANVLMSRAELVKTLMDPRRDIYDSCGLLKTPIPYTTYQFLYEREAVAARVVECMPRECWQVTPVIYEAEEGDEPTEFEAAWDALGRGLRGEKSWFVGDEGNPVLECLMRADIQAGIGQYGVILLGLDDGAQSLAEPATFIAGVPPPPDVAPPSADGDPLNPAAPAPPRPTPALPSYDDLRQRGPGAAPEPATPQRTEGGYVRLRYLRVFPEALATIAQSDADRNSPRYGQPTYYDILFNSPQSNAGLGGSAATVGTVQRVHWTRVIHVAETDTVSSEVYGAPRMRPVYNNLAALMKLYHGSAEMYWMGAFPGLSIETPEGIKTSMALPMEKLQTMMYSYFNDLQRWIALKGMTAKPLAPQVSSPRDQIDVHIEAICIKLGIPKRIFMGSERGELASSQDDASWNDRLRARQNNFITPKIICPLVDRLIMLGVLPEPADGYRVHWPDLDSQTDAEKATIAVTKATALSTFAAQPAILDGYGWFDFLTRVMGHTEDEARVIMETAAEEQQLRQEQAMAAFEEQQRIAAAQQAAAGLADQPGAAPSADGVPSPNAPAAPVVSAAT